MKPTYEYCSRCKSTTQHLNGDCNCYQQSHVQKKILKIEQIHKTSPEILSSIRELQSIYNNITSNV